METPQIVPSVGTPIVDPFNLMDRLAEKETQTITNRQAYDIIYPTHRSYYDDKRFVVYDKNFDKTEEYLLNQFKSAIDSAVNYSNTTNVFHVDEFNRNGVDVQGLTTQVKLEVPMIHKDVLVNDKKYVDSSFARNVTISSSDPYGTIRSGLIQ